jgi:fatty-acyl-CoA synthase
MSMLIGRCVGTDAAPGSPRATAATLGAQEISFGALDAAANRLARALAGSGVGPRDTVLWWTAPTLHALAGMLACARLGAVFAPVSVLLGRDSVNAIADYVAPRLLVCDPERLETGRAIDGVPVALVGGERTAAPAGTGPVELDRLSEVVSDASLADSGVREREPHILYLTSGSTGRPKGVLVSHRASWLRSAPAAGAPRPGGELCTFPLYHYGGWHYVMEAWLRGAAVHLVEKADGAHVAEAVARRRPEAIYCIPAVWERLLATDGDLSSIRYADTGTSSFGDDLLERIAARLPQARTRVLYGASEAGRMTALEHPQLAAHPGSVGRAVGEGSLRLADDGEIVFSGPTLMNGYLDMPEATTAVLGPRGYRTGDLGRWDDDGFLYIVGRKSEAIRTAGEWVSPVEVESAIASLPGVVDVAVVGVPDAQWGEIVCAAMVPVPGRPLPTVEELRGGLGGLARHAHPRLVAAIAEIPRTTATGQVMRATVRRAVIESLARSSDSAN